MPLFGRRASAAKSTTPRQTQGAQLQRITLAKSRMDSTDPYDPVGGVVAYINGCLEIALLKPHELPQEAVQAYYCDYYLAQVNNGGHAQFFSNLGKHCTEVLPVIPKGLDAMGADQHAQIFREAEAWLTANGPMKGMRERPEPLSDLDTRFFAVEGGTEAFIALNSAWIRSWSSLDIVEDDAYDAIIKQLPMLNPAFETRHIAGTIRGIETYVQEDPYLSLALALNNGADQTVHLRGIGNGRFTKFGGDSEIAWSMRTATGTLTGFSTLEGAFVFDDSGEGDEARMVGKLSREIIEQVRRVAADMRVSSAVDLLLRKAGMSSPQSTPVAIVPDAQILKPKGERVLTARVLVQGKPHELAMNDQRAALVDVASNIPVARAEADDIFDHWQHRED